jgi:hypothetical protein
MLEFKGDSSDLEGAVGRVGQSTRDLSDNMTRLGSSASDSGDRTERLADHADVAERRFTGFYDTIGGVTEGLAVLKDSSASTTEKLIGLGMAGADLAGGLAEFVIPMVAKFAGFLRVGLGSAMSFIAAHPLMIALLVLVAIFVLLWTHSETFRRIVIGAFNAIADFTVNVLGAAWRWLVDIFLAAKDTFIRGLQTLGAWFTNTWNWIVDIGIRALQIYISIPGRILNAFIAGLSAVGSWFRSIFNSMIAMANSFLQFNLSIPGRILSVFSSLAAGIRDAFRRAFNFVSTAWNNTVGRLSWTVPSWVPGIGGRSISAPRLPTFHGGGIVPGPPGTELLAVLQAGERVVPASSQAAGTTRVVFAGNLDSAMATAFMHLFRTGQIRIQTV